MKLTKKDFLNQSKKEITRLKKRLAIHEELCEILENKETTEKNFISKILPTITKLVELQTEQAMEKDEDL